MVKTKHSPFMIALKFNSLFVNVFTFTSGFALRQFFFKVNVRTIKPPSPPHSISFVFLGTPSHLFGQKYSLNGPESHQLRFL